MFDAIPKFPGFIVLHDLVLHHAVIGMTLGRGDKAGYLAWLKQAYGAEGQQVAQSVLSGRGDEPNLFLRYPVVEPWLAGSLGVIGHNNYVVDQVRERTPGIPVRRIVQHFFLPEGFPPGFDGGAFRRELGLTDDPVVASFGFFIPDKRLGLVMRAFKRLLRRHPRATYLLVGGSSPHYDLQGELNTMGLGGRVRLTGWQSQVSFVKHLFVPDVAVHLRYPHIGGTPYTPVRLLGLGIPTIVSDIEPLAELPPDAVVRVRPNEPDEESMLFAAMDYLLTRPDVAAAMGKNGQGYIAANHNLPAVIEQFVDFFAPPSRRPSAPQPTPTRRTRAQTLSARMSSLAGSALADSGLRESSEALLAPVARVIRDLSRPPRDEVQ